MKRSIIIGVGLPKTGTTSLKKALLTLGFNKGGANKYDNPDAEVFVGDYNCLPTTRYRQLDMRFPDAKFILTLRDSPETWYDSVSHWAARHKDNKGIVKQRKSMYGFEFPVKKPFIDQYKEHARGVYDYFNDRYHAKLKEKLLIVCWEDGDGWEELCEFLNKPVPDKKFPKANANEKKNK
jgi:hypothetical protein